MVSSKGTMVEEDILEGITITMVDTMAWVISAVIMVATMVVATMVVDIMVVDIMVDIIVDIMVITMGSERPTPNQ